MSAREMVNGIPDPGFDDNNQSFAVTAATMTRAGDEAYTTYDGVILKTVEALGISTAWRKAREVFEERGDIINKPALYFQGAPSMSVTLPDAPNKEGWTPRFPVGHSMTMGQMAVLASEHPVTTHTPAGFLLPKPGV